ncbi:oligopeptide/dipeptide ABC transporter, ATPase subunit [Thermaerobacter marianensis DSM 12885]|uniref:Oligopeptide/dipeptide ABC transporter, ATPase subunit n=1 Tax=Thermaerobacter marianensis (strain ATCC 700841 / DSM 12885 / JCM 10246 / 7p75a) TaxID=644966 RepID=E6SHL7_THEM7|nr:ABC transporter ATP-binding protein [Thermaerobacter marianensis]ADU51812.1 oligopeptide/dipeptide ABC transporter, ATPase subunit [Thermaerobacter marianensis DSM 12885]
MLGKGEAMAAMRPVAVAGAGPAARQGRPDPAAPAGEPLLVVENLEVTFFTDEGPVPAVRGVSLTVGQGEVVALVGESGSGKSVTARAITGLVPPPGRVVGGRICLAGRDLMGLSPAAWRSIRGREVGLVFQDPMTSLDPLFTVGDQLVEAITAHRRMPRARALARAEELLALAGLPRPADRLRQYPHELSGGMRQRVLIAMALATPPRLVIADEPTTALDVTIQAQILALLDDLRRQTGASLLLITHNLGVVAELADRVYVMYGGRIAEAAPVDRLFTHPSHPYTRALLAAVPDPFAAEARPPDPIPGDPPDPRRLPAGCPFAGRCPVAEERCFHDVPPMRQLAPGHVAACWLLEEDATGRAGGAGGATGTRGENGAGGVNGAGAVNGTGGVKAACGASMAVAGCSTEGGSAAAPRVRVTFGTGMGAGGVGGADAEGTGTSASHTGAGGPGTAHGVPGTATGAAGTTASGTATLSPASTAPATGRPEALLRLEDVATTFPVRRGWRQVRLLRAVDGVSLEVRRGETLGLVGESGCGKTTLGRTIVRLYRPARGRILFRDRDLATLDEPSLRSLRRHLQMVFQDPYASLDPRMRVEDLIAEPLHLIPGLSRKEQRERVRAMLARVGLRPEHALRYPHEFSGGQRQRIGIARALVVEPELVIADEPLSALDVSVQAQILRLLGSLQEELGLSYLLITHDLAVVRHVCQRVAVMYLGRVVEEAPVEELFARPLHPYTQALLAAIPVPDPLRARQRERQLVQGEPPDPVDPPSGCPFRNRCPLAQARCAEEVPALRELAPGHRVACHLAG